MSIQKIKVLLLDDDTGFLESFKKTLESKNCEVDCVTTTREALSCLICNLYSVVFIDCVLNTERGPDMIADIRKILGSSVQIVVISGIVPGKSLSTYMDLGVSDFLSKPLSDQEINALLKNIRDKHRFGEEKSNLLNKIFNKSLSRIDALKDIISLKKLKGYEFFIHLGHALSMKEPLSLNFRINDKNHNLQLNQGKVIDYQCGNINLFIDSLLSKNFIDSKQSFLLKQKSEKECVNYLLSEFILSPQQITELKYNLLISGLKEISPDTELSVKFDISSDKNREFLILDQKDYADLVLSFLIYKFNNKLFHLFDKAFMKKHMIFEGKPLQYPDEMQKFIKDLKSGLKLQTIYKQYLEDKNKFCFYVIYVLLKGRAFVSENNKSLRYQFLIERYKHLYQFIRSCEQPEEIFKTFSGLSIVSVKDVKELYTRFINNNHPDKLQGMEDLPKDLFEKINQVQRILKNRYEQSINPKLREKIEKEKREKQMDQLIVIREKAKIIERYLSDKRYKEAFDLLKPLSKKANSKNIDILFLYLWLYYKAGEDLELDRNIFIQGIKTLKAGDREYSAQSLFHYIIGLHYMAKDNFVMAKRSFKRSQQIDPSFGPCYEEIKKCNMIELKIKSQEKNSLMSKITRLKITTNFGISKKQKKAK